VHEQFASLATRLIAKNGRPLELVTLHETGESWNPTITEQTALVVGVNTSFKMGEVDGTLVRATDKLFLIDAMVEVEPEMRLRDYKLGAGTSLKPLGEWRVGIDPFGVAVPEVTPIDYSIVAVIEVKPGTRTIMYKVQARV